MAELEALEANLAGLTELGANLVALSPQTENHNVSAGNDLGLGFPVVTDVNNQLATAFGLTTQTPPEVIEAERFLGLDLPTHNGNDNWDLPIPARYVIGKSGLIRLATFHVDHRIRVDPAELLEQLVSLCQ